MGEQKLNDSSLPPALQQTDVSGSFYQDEFTRRPNVLLYKMRVLFDKNELTTWEFHEFRKMVRSFCKEYDLHFDENKEMVYKRGEQNCH